MTPFNVFFFTNTAFAQIIAPLHPAEHSTLQSFPQFVQSPSCTYLRTEQIFIPDCFPFLERTSEGPSAFFDQGHNFLSYHNNPRFSTAELLCYSPNHTFRSYIIVTSCSRETENNGHHQKKNKSNKIFVLF